MLTALTIVMLAIMLWLIAPTGRRHRGGSGTSGDGAGGDFSDSGFGWLDGHGHSGDHGGNWSDAGGGDGGGGDGGGGGD